MSVITVFPIDHLCLVFGTLGIVVSWRRHKNKGMNGDITKYVVNGMGATQLPIGALLFLASFDIIEQQAITQIWSSNARFILWISGIMIMVGSIKAIWDVTRPA